MLSSLRQNILAYFRVNLALYFFIVLLFIVGVVFGAMAVKTLGEEQKSELITYLKVFFQGLNKGQANVLDNGIVAKQAIINNVKTVGVIWLLGITVIGVPVILFIVFTRGFVVGFTVGFLVNEYLLRGVAFAIASVVPHNFLVLPAVIIAAVSAVSFSLLIVKNRMRHNRLSLTQEFLSYTGLSFIMLGIIVTGGLVEGYITPVFMKLAIKLFTKS